MAIKIRVHELAKELGKDNKDIVDYLTGKGITGKTAVSLVPEAEVIRLREMYGEKKAEEAVQAPSAGPEKPAAGKDTEAEAPKKKTIIRVIRTQNASGRIPVRSREGAAAERREPVRRPVRPARPEGGRPEAGRPGAVRPGTVKPGTVRPGVVRPGAARPAAPAAAGAEAERVAARAEAMAAAAANAEAQEAAKAAENAAAAAEAAAAAANAEAVKAGIADAAAGVKAEAEVKAPAAEEGAKAPESAADSAAAVAAQQGAIGEAVAAESAAKEVQPSAEQAPAAASEKAAVSGSSDGAQAEASAEQTGKDAESAAAGARPAAPEKGRKPAKEGKAPERRQPINQDPRNVRTDLLRKSPEERARMLAEFEKKKQAQKEAQQKAGQGRSRGQGQAQGQRGGAPAGRGERGDRQGQGGGNRQGAGGRGQQAGGQQGGRFGGRGAGAPQGGQQDRPARGGEKRVFSVRHEVPADSALAHKTTRDFHGKDRDRQKNDRRGFEEQPQHGGQGRKFNKVPKALQTVKPKTEEVKKEVVTEITIPERITIRDLADKMKIQASQIIKSLFMKGEIMTVNHEIPFEKAEEIAMEYDIIAEMEEKEDVIAELLKEDEEDEKDMVARPPVVCVMGHVDHGKTSLLDAIRNTNVTDREAGGITQHIGAYMITVNGQKITFLDTPGHEAFTAMRMRGANSTDIAVLVVAADDGVMPQTVEAINHAKAAGVEIIVAINKIDKPAANIDRVKQELADYQLIPEEWGGQTIFCPVSAKTHEGIENLLEMILLAAEVKELKANPNRNARGLVLEAKLDRGRGPVATILVQKGTLRQGDFIACGASSGKVRAMTDDKGRIVKKATPSMPVEIIGLNAVPGAGEVLVSLDSDKEAKAFAATFVTENKKTLLEATQAQMSLEDVFNRIQEGNLKELPLIVKADVQGSVEAVSQSLLKLSNDEVVVKVIHGAVGNVSESDVNLAAASGALILGFNVKADATAKSIAEQNNIEIRLYNVIYQVIDDVERALKGMRAAVYEEKILGHAVVRQIFKASGIGNIAGSYVTDGTLERKCKIRIRHNDEVIFDGDLASIKRFKDDVKEVREGYECGLVFDGFNDFEVDDVVEAYKMVQVEQQ